MKIQPIDFNALPEHQPKPEAAARPVFKLRFKRLFERPFSIAPRAPAAEKAADLPPNCTKDSPEEFEPSSICLAKFVQNFLEGGSEKQTQKCGRRKCNCFHRNCAEISDEEPSNPPSGHAIDLLKSLVLISSASERNLLSDITKIVEKNKISKRKDEICRKIVADGLMNLGYKASICKSKWEKTPSFLAGVYEYVDVMIKGERFIIDIDFRSEFEVARATKAYRLILQTLPTIFVGKANRLEKIISIVSEAAKQSLKKRGMPLPPWRKPDYIKAKWLSPFTRLGPANSCECEFNLNPSEKFEPFEIRPTSVKKGAKIVTGLASIIENKP